MKRKELAKMFRDIINNHELDDRTIDNSNIPNCDKFIKFLILKNKGTPYVLLFPDKCDACWECIAQCPRNVFGKVSFLWHKHAKIINAEACNGCMKCFNVCKYEAIYKINLAK